MKLLYVIPSYNRRDLLLNHVWSILQHRHSNLIQYTVFCYIQGPTGEDIEKYEEFRRTVGDSVIFKYVPKYETFICGKMRRDAILMANRCCPNHDVVWWADDDMVHTHQNPVLDKLLLETFQDQEYMTVNLKVAQNGADRIKWKKGFNPDSGQQFFPTVNMGILFRVSDLHKIMSPDIEKIDSGEDLYPFMKSLIFKKNYLIVTLDETTMKDVINAPGGAFDKWSEEYPGLPKDMTARNEFITNHRKSSIQTRFADFFHYDSAFVNGKRVRNNVLDYISTNIVLDQEFNIIRHNPKCIMPVDGTVRKVYGLHLRDYSHLAEATVPL